MGRGCDCVFVKRDNNGKVIESGCGKNAVKKCRHNFYTCDKCYHGCKNEEKILIGDAISNKSEQESK